DISGYAKPVLRLEAAQRGANVRQIIKKSNAIGLTARELTGDRKSLAQPRHAHRVVVRANTCTRYGLPSAVGHYALISHYRVFQGINHDVTAQRRGARTQILELVVSTLVIWRVVRVSKPRQVVPPTVQRALCL